VQLIIVDPEDPERVLLLRAKNNLVSREIETGLAFKLVSTEVQPGIIVPRIEWEAGEVTTTAREAMNSYNRPDNDRKSADEVRDWLRGVLLNGPVLQTIIEEEGKKLNISLDQLKRAKKKIGVDSRKVDMNGSWEWYLIGGKGTPGEGALKGAVCKPLPWPAERVLRGCDYLQ
jgi:hypothetical protein